MIDLKYDFNYLTAFILTHVLIILISGCNRAESEKEDVSQAIDEMQNDIIRQLKKDKKKSEALFKKGARGIKRM